MRRDYALFLARCVRLAEGAHTVLIYAGDCRGGGAGVAAGGSGGGANGAPRTCGVLAPHVVGLVKKVRFLKTHE